MIDLRDPVAWSECEAGDPSHTLKLPLISIDNENANGVAWRLRLVYANTLRRLMAYDKQHLFSTPLDNGGIPEYERVVKKPMNFGKMWEKLDHMAYMDDPSLFDEDISLVIANMKTYNPPPSAQHQAGLALEKLYEIIRPHMIKNIANTMEQQLKKGSNASVRGKGDTIAQKSDPNYTADETASRYNFLDPTSTLRTRRKRKFPTEDSHMSVACLRPPRYLHPVVGAVTQSTMENNIAWEQVGMCLNSQGGLSRILSALESMHNRLHGSPYAQMSWFPEFTEPHRRAIKEFEYRKHASDSRTHENLDPQAYGVLSNRLRLLSYRNSIINFVGSTNISKLEDLYPNLLDMLNDLQINPYLVLTSRELMF